MHKKLIWMFLLASLLIACAQVPRESVELSATVGRDLEAVHESHRELAQILFSRMKDDINRFVDQVYAPYQINLMMARQKDLANSPDEAERKRSLLLAINAAFKDGAPPELQEAVLQGMESMVMQIRTDVESMRGELLAPVTTQEQEVLNSIEQAYRQIQDANSIVTGHLASIVKVHDVQADLLASVGVERDLRQTIGTKLARISEQLNDLVDKAGQADENLPAVEENIRQMKEVLNGLHNQQNPSNEETN